MLAVSIAAAAVGLHRHAQPYFHSVAAARRHAAAAASTRPVAAGEGPVFPDRWAATVNETIIENGKPIVAFIPFGVNMAYAQDVTKKRTSFGFKHKLPWAPKEFVGTPQEYINWTQLETDGFDGIEMNGQKLQSPTKPWFNMFSWTPQATFKCQTTFDGRIVDNYTYSNSVEDAYVLVAKDGSPVHLSTHIVTPSMTYNLTYTFIEFTPNATDGAWDGFDENDYTHPMVCPAGQGPLEPVNVTMYIFHPAHNFNVTNQDLGDATGDVFFTCVDVITNQSTSVDHHYQWITQWDVELLPRWGEYLNCNGYPPVCSGAENWWVGHEAAQGLGSPTAGQCTENKLTGEWWSLPSGGRCADGVAPAEGKCTWRTHHVKTIDGECLIGKQSYRDACIADARAPFRTATKKFVDAFASEDAKKGGCPALPYSP